MAGGAATRGFLRTRITESPLRNILEMYRSLFTGFPFFFCPFPDLGNSVHISLTFSKTMLQCRSNALTLASNFRLFRQLIRTWVLFLTDAVRMDKGPVVNSSSSLFANSSGVISLFGFWSNEDIVNDDEDVRWINYHLSKRKQLIQIVLWMKMWLRSTRDLIQRCRLPDDDVLRGTILLSSVPPPDTTRGSSHHIFTTSSDKRHISNCHHQLTSSQHDQDDHYHLIRLVNSCFELKLGYPLEEILGRNENTWIRKFQNRYPTVVKF